MAYSEKADLIKAKDETILKQIAGENGLINDDWIADAIEAADAKIDINCGKYYTVPFTPVPKIIKRWSVQLAICWLYRRSNSSNESAENQCDSVTEMLKAVSDGDLEIPGVTKKVSGMVISEIYDDNIFDMDTTLET